MGTSLEDLRVLQDAEAIADGVWQQVAAWEPFAREVVGGQLARAADSIGANIAEGFGRLAANPAQSLISNLQSLYHIT